MRIPGDLTKPIWLQENFDPLVYVHIYRAELVRHVDGDSMRVFLDKGMGDFDMGVPKNGVAPGVNIRYARINAYETRGEERPLGLKAMEFVKSHLAPGEKFWLFTYKDNTDVYSRLLCDIMLPDRRCLNDLVVENGHGVYKRYP